MKNKALRTVLLGLLLLTAVGIGMSLGKSDKPTPAPNGGKKSIKIGVLQYITHPSLDEIYKGIKDGLKEEGFEEGKNLTIDYMNAEGDQSQVQTMSNLLVSHDNDLYVGIATPAAQGLAAAEKSKPVILGAVTDPVGANLIADLQHPGGNLTGVSDQAPVADEVKLVKQLTPDVKKIGVLYSSNEANSKAQVEEFTKTAEKEGFAVTPYAISSSNDIISTVGVMSAKVDAIYVPVDNTIANSFESVIATANKHKTPVYTSVEDMVSKGSIASVSLSQYELGVATGKMMARVANGANPADTPVEIYNTGSVVINETAARKLGITIPEDVHSSSKIME